ncbi:MULTISPECIES: hypothetical protein [unclassified Eikenella]|uniref:hypothetical protein n=1 Tax=unclassified Eikenella TaxID=2639367 RepID=UPI0012E8B7F6|nr:MULTISPECIES: hypothetical protein [unclassified Eikenella]
MDFAVNPCFAFLCDDESPIKVSLLVVRFGAPVVQIALGDNAVQPGYQNTVFYQKPLRLAQCARDYSKFRHKYTKNLHLATKNDTSRQQSKQSVLAIHPILPAYCQTCAAYPPEFFR